MNTIEKQTNSIQTTQTTPPKVAVKSIDSQDCTVEVPKSFNEKLKTTFGTDNSELAQHLMSQLVNIELDVDDLVKTEKVINTNLAIISGIGPRDVIESMLATQMGAIHAASLQSLNLAHQAANGQKRDLHLSQVVKLTRVFTNQIEALNKHRGRGQQKITVEHVTVEQGGQAIVGNVGGGG